MALSVLYIPCASENQAQKVAWHLISKKLIACANIFPITSIYSWKGKVMNAKEFVIIAKSSKSKFDEVKREVKQVHSYEIPCVVMWEGTANEEYQKWVNDQLGIIQPKHFSAKKVIKNLAAKLKSHKKKILKRKK